jgi:hypothetical protein
MSRESSAGLKTKTQTKLGADPKRIKRIGDRQERQLTINLLLLRVEGGTCGGRCLLQLEDDSFFCLAGLPHLFIRHALLDQLAREPCDLQVPELEGGLHLIQRSTLPLKLALRLLSAQRSRSRVARASSRTDRSNWS